MANKEVTPELLMEKFTAAHEELKEHTICHATEANVTWIYFADGRWVKVIIRPEVGMEVY